MALGFFIHFKKNKIGSFLLKLYKLFTACSLQYSYYKAKVRK